MTLRVLCIILCGFLVGNIVPTAIRALVAGMSGPGEVELRAPRAVCPSPPVRPDLSLPATSVMQAVATNDRHLAGARCQGCLIGPTVRMLA